MGALNMVDVLYDLAEKHALDDAKTSLYWPRIDTIHTQYIMKTPNDGVCDIVDVEWGFAQYENLHFMTSLLIILSLYIRWKSRNISLSISYIYT